MVEAAGRQQCPVLVSQKGEHPFVGEAISPSSAESVIFDLKPADAESIRPRSTNATLKKMEAVPDKFYPIQCVGTTKPSSVSSETFRKWKQFFHERPVAHIAALMAVGGFAAGGFIGTISSGGLFSIPGALIGMAGGAIGGLFLGVMLHGFFRQPAEDVVAIKPYVW